ncbi:MAG: hypothetical protein WCP12_05055 [bacterium]
MQTTSYTLGIFAAAVLQIMTASAAEPEVQAKALKYRIVSFNEARLVDKELIRQAADLGYNGVMIQMAGSNLKRVKELIECDKKEGIFDFCHQRGMKVTVWVRELMDMPKEKSPGALGSVTLENQKLWDYLAERYEWMLKEALPKADGLVLTVVESQIKVTDAALMNKLTDVIHQKCRKYGKTLIVRTFVWHPEELEGVMGAVAKMPEETVIMSKVVPQDWQMRGIDAMEIGRVGNREQIVEYDVAGEYFLRDNVANCFPDVLKRQFDYGIAHGVDGICVRIDRRGASVLHGPQEVNLWALGMFATGKSMTVDEVWSAWAEARYGQAAAPGVVRALKPTGAVVAEMLSVGPFTVGDTRGFPPRPDENYLNQNWQNWRWDASLLPQKVKVEEGDPAFTREVEDQKSKAANLARQALEDLAKVEDKLDPADYQILHTKLLTNAIQLEFRSAMTLVILRINRLLRTHDANEKAVLLSALAKDLQTIRSVAQRDYGTPVEIEKFGRKWKVGVPQGLNVKKMNEWVEKTQNYISEKGTVALTQRNVE